MHYDIIRSNRRTMALEITSEGRVVIRAPKTMPQSHIDDFYQSHTDWIQTHLQRQQAWQQAHPEPDAATEQALRRQARIILPKKVAYYGGRMQLYPTGITITGARTRFGSCSAKGRLCFSWRLMTYPEEAIDYVVVHELAHLAHPNHSPAFHALVESILPDHKARRKLLRD